MKKTDMPYVAKWFGVPTALVVILFAAGGITGNTVLLLGGGALLVLFPVIVLSLMRKSWLKKADALEGTFGQVGFDYQYKFTSNSGIFYIDQGGRLAVVWKFNPTELSFANLGHISDIHVHDGKQLMGTALVSCQFTLAGKRYKIYTLRVSNGQLPMNSPKVIEAIAKADNLCKMLAAAQQNAIAKAS